MKVTAKDKTFDIDPEDFDSVTSYKELAEIERVMGSELANLKPMQMIGATVWTLVKRQDPAARIDDIDFDVKDLPQDESEGKDESPSASDETAPST